ncbi:uncharacterized protein LOC131659805 [Vicia villosa]|uniref:uncharacterized protein LOC131659805 n=1 Tax=Vicia villosa TaxID=3911 RepID=UPI00273CB4BA|nr:uncharacterized protein LOC131659805 [Vicia villosa]
MACQNRLPTKDRLSKIGVITYGLCVYCDQMETSQHLFFACAETKRTWMQLLTWMRIRHIHGEWTEEVNWICSQTKGKSGRAKLLKLAATEMVYAIWNQRNKIIFQNGKKEALRSMDIKEIVVVVSDVLYLVFFVGFVEL